MVHFGTTVLSAVVLLNGVNGRSLAPRQAPTLPSDQANINATRNDRTPVTLHVNTKNTSARNQTSPYLYGLMHEDISHSGDGGIYGEMIANRAFQGSTAKIGTIEGYSGSLVENSMSDNPIIPFGPVPHAWAPIGEGTRLNLDILHPLSDALPTSLQIDIKENATGEVGFKNFGWWGFNVNKGEQYNVSFYALANYARNLDNATAITVSFRSNTTGEVFASSTIPAQKYPEVDFQQVKTTLVPTKSAPDGNNTFCITMEGSDAAGLTFYFNLVSVFPETFKGYQNGLRRDIAQAFYDIKPGFLRFPGGNNIEGYSPQQRWNWRKARGPLSQRPGRVGDWSYYNTQGLGLLEYLEWCEAMDMEPVLAVYSGFSLDIWGQNGASYPENRMDEIVQDALDELEYCTGGADTHYGAMRVADGHPAPFKINFVELGNEDWFSTTYPYRFPPLYKGIKAKYPNVTIISTAYDENPDYNITIPAGGMWDWHSYEEPSWFLENFNLWDNWQERTNNHDVTVLLGEYSAIQIDTPDGNVNYSFPPDTHIYYPRLLSAISEGVYAIGAERNPNTVRMSSYAPSLENRNFVNWTPDMISFDSQYGNTVRSASYWQQWLFSHFHGTQTLPVTNSGGQLNPLFWVVSYEESCNAIYVKVINTLNASVPLTVDFDTQFRSVNGTILTATDLNSYNYIHNQTEVVPKPINIPQNSGGGYGGQTNFKWDVPKFSINVLQFNL